MELVIANLYNRAKENVSWLPTNNYDANQVEYVALVDYTYIIPYYNIRFPTQLFHANKYITPSSMIKRHDLALKDIILRSDSALRDIILRSTKKESDTVCNF